MKFMIEIKYLGQTARMVVDYDDEKLVDTNYNIGRQFNIDCVETDFYNNVEITALIEQ